VCTVISEYVSVSGGEKNGNLVTIVQWPNRFLYLTHYQYFGKMHEGYLRTIAWYENGMCVYVGI
jgi:hypothetical protein